MKSRRIRAGKGKMRNRRHTQKRGPCVIYDKDEGISRAFRNIPGRLALHFVVPVICPAILL